MSEINFENTYWNNKGKYQKEYDKIFSELVPASGKCKTLEGELLRAASKIYYDLYNNGFGNNWSGPWYFLKGHIPNSNLKNALEEISYYKQGKIIINSRQEIYDAVEVIINVIFEYILSKDGKYNSNDADMWDFGIDDEKYYRDEEDDDYES